MSTNFTPVTNALTSLKRELEKLPQTDPIKHVIQFLVPVEGLINKLIADNQ
jgi:hypothetical protein